MLMAGENLKLGTDRGKERNESWSLGELLGGQARIWCLSKRKVEGKERSRPVWLKGHNCEVVTMSPMRKLNLRG